MGLFNSSGVAFNSRLQLEWFYIQLEASTRVVLLSTRVVLLCIPFSWFSFFNSIPPSYSWFSFFNFQRTQDMNSISRSGLAFVITNPLLQYYSTGPKCLSKYSSGVIRPIYMAFCAILSALSISKKISVSFSSDNPGHLLAAQNFGW